MVEASDLRLAVLVSRHGIRSPGFGPQGVDCTNKLTNGETAYWDNYSSTPWPQFIDSTPEKPWGSSALQPHGVKVINTLGSYFRNHVAGFNSIAGPSCSASEVNIVVYSAAEERCIGTAISLLNGLLPNCPGSLSKVKAPAATYSSFNGGSPVTIYVPANGSNTPFSTNIHTVFKTGSDKSNLPTCGASGVNGLGSALGISSSSDPAEMKSEMNRGQVFLTSYFNVAVRRVADYLGDFSDALCTAPPCSLMTTPTTPFNAKHDQFCGPFGIYNYFANVFQLQYANGMPTAGGQISTAAELLQVTAGYWFKQELILDYEASQSFGSELLAGILASIDLALLGALPGDIPSEQILQHGSNAAATMVYYSGHHEQVAWVRRLLDLRWTVCNPTRAQDAFNTNQPVFGGILSFEVLQNGCPDPSNLSGYTPTAIAACTSVQLYYTAQSPDQIRHALPLNSTNPPSRVNLFVPECSKYQNRITGACGYVHLRTIMLKKIRSECIYHEALRAYVNAAQANCSGANFSSLSCVPGEGFNAIPIDSDSGSTGTMEAIVIVLAVASGVLGMIVAMLLYERFATGRNSKFACKHSNIDETPLLSVTTRDTTND